MDPDKLLPEDRQRIQQMTGLQMPGAMPGQPELSTVPEAETVNGAGDMSGGRDFALPMYPKRPTATAPVSTIPGRAMGGPVSAGQPYVVGENKPETMITPLLGDSPRGNRLADYARGVSSKMEADIHREVDGVPSVMPAAAPTSTDTQPGANDSPAEYQRKTDEYMRTHGFKAQVIGASGPQVIVPKEDGYVVP